MFRPSGKPKNWFATTLVGVGFPLLLVALVLAAATPSSRTYPPSVSDAAEEEVAAREGTLEAAAMRTSPVGIDLAGWELYLHSAEVGILEVGLTPTGGVLPLAARIAAAGYSIPAASSLPVRVHYQPQAPPV